MIELFLELLEEVRRANLATTANVSNCVKFVISCAIVAKTGVKFAIFFTFHLTTSSSLTFSRYKFTKISLISTFSTQKSTFLKEATPNKSLGQKSHDPI